MENQEKKSWKKNTVMVKIGIIGILIVLLLIPLALIQNVIDEREFLNEKAIDEVSSKWANKQQIKGPILTIPLVLERIDKEGEKIKYTQDWIVLPDQLTVDGVITPEALGRGIYEIIVYTSQLNLRGKFVLDEVPNKSELIEIQYDKAFLTIGISDLRGIKNQIKMKWNDNLLTVKPGTKIPDLIESGVTIPIALTKENLSSFDFNFDLDLQGSQNLSFIPLGATTQVALKSNWNSPSFVGNFLPDQRDITEEGFTASWKVLQLNRNFPQQWISQELNYKQIINKTEFGLNLILPLDDYQKSTRSAKYGLMTIVLTFLIFFLIEIINKTRIHPLQYAMVGFALSIFYILLVSISEHTNFNFAYGVSTFSIVTMIFLYSLTLFKNKKLSYLLLSILCAIYSFLFITLQMVDYALLMGSIGITVILACTMYYTRKINWYKLNLETT
ncbi:cell envelope integrity protein CreD [Flammeovirga pectinis]|uniref:Cell envelope integrity protein CreD n=1 Tax=Flammeovirga pectinis TaxID=2494373 RepID=A0A3Q9FU50_9BACT|nr:cell envelope integrity protein CreD [Flammeovirga pectinis]AZQ64659.1 cell envelope integrity protein CreD [Flammeovirga pectinis]